MNCIVCGLATGQGKSAQKIMSDRSTITEGVALKHMALEHGVDMPICTAMTDILSGELIWTA